MPFNPEIGQELQIDNVTYHLTEHPAAPGMPYGQEGRAAVVYQLLSTDGKMQALKVFKPHYRLPILVGQAEKIAPYATLPGLQVCERTVLSARRHGTLLRQYPDLTYAILMPWVAGPTWTSLLLEKRALSPEQGLALARSLAYVLAGMEEHGLAHCDLSGSNLLLPGLISLPTVARRSAVELVDMEQLYSSDLKRPETLPGGSPGYVHIATSESFWSAYADRFAGAVLLAEILGWCEAKVRKTAWGENYFAPDEVQRESERAQTLTTALTLHWGESVVHLFEQAWRSDTLAACPTFGEWLVTLPETVPVMQGIAQTVLPQSPSPTTAPVIEDTLRAFMGLAQQFETQGNLIGALQTYHQALALATPESGLAAELTVIVKDLEAQQVVVPAETTVPGITTQAETVLIETLSPPETQLSMAVEPMLEVAIESVSETNPVEPASDVVVEPRENMQPQELPEPSPPSFPATKPDLAKLFDDGLAAYQKQDWIAARELFTTVVQQEPEYAYEGKAVDILADIERRLATKESLKESPEMLSLEVRSLPPHPVKTSTKRRLPVWTVFGVIALAVVTLIVANSIDSRKGFTTPTQSHETPSVASKLTGTGLSYRILIAGDQGISIVQVPSGSIVSQLSSEPTESAEFTDDGNILVADYYGRIKLLNLEGEELKAISSPYSGNIMHALPSETSIWISTPIDGGNQPGTVANIDWQGNMIALVEGFHYPMETRYMSNGNLIIADGTSQLTIVTTAGEIVQTIGLSDWASAVCPLSNGTIFVGTPDGLIWIDGDGKELEVIDGQRVNSIEQLPWGNLLIIVQSNHIADDGIVTPNSIIKEVSSHGDAVWAIEFETLTNTARFMTSD